MSPIGWYGFICCICFNGLTEDTCFVDSNGDKWDVCSGKCAEDAGFTA